MPVGAYGGSRELMQQIAPSGPIYQAGTLSGNPVAMAAGLAMLELIPAPGFHADIERCTNVLCDGLEAAAGEAGVALTTQRVGGRFGLDRKSVVWGKRVSVRVDHRSGRCSEKNTS